MTDHESVGAWAKRYHLAARAVIESILRQHDLGPTQWYVLYQLANGGPTKQRDLGRLLNLERATLSGIVAALVRKGLIGQVPDPADQRQRILCITPAGAELWEKLPDPIALTNGIAFDGADPAELATAARVLRTATHRLQAQLPEGGESPQH
ncbi:MAG TPA: MarR family transcriptional regulator [Propionicimonas sp.]|jgi:DNA-binding MarR family transcriptional regulator